HQPMPYGVLTGHQARSIGTAYRETRYGIAEINGFASERVNRGGLRVRITRVPERLCPPLINEHKENLRPAPIGGSGNRRPAGSLQKSTPVDAHGLQRYSNRLCCKRAETERIGD